MVIVDADRPKESVQNLRFVSFNPLKPLHLCSITTHSPLTQSTITLISPAEAFTPLHRSTYHSMASAMINNVLEKLHLTGNTPAPEAPSQEDYQKLPSMSTKSHNAP
jgi:hypothetical protein